MQPHHGINNTEFSYLIIGNLKTVTLASSNNAFPYDGVCTEIFRSSFNVNLKVHFKIILKQLTYASFGD
jgi:hypothetical protein